MKINVDEYRDYLFSITKELLNTPSPSGYYKRVMEVVRREATECGFDFKLTNRGAGVISIKGSTDGAIGLCAHCDTLGAMVRSVSNSGEINFTVIGGPILPTLDGEYCTVITREGKQYSGTFLSKSPASHVFSDSSTRQRNAENMYVRLDEVVRTAADVKKLGISSGDYICFDPKTVVTGSGFLKSRFIDDKASVGGLLTLMKILSGQKITPKNDILILITMHEEVGTGASYLPTNVKSMLAVDMGCIGSDLGCTEYDVSICAKDSGGPYDYEFTSNLIELAKKNDLNYSVDIYPYYGSDIGAMWRAGHDIPGALIGTGVHASHGMERTHYDGLKNTLKLILLYIGLEV